MERPTTGRCWICLSPLEAPRFRSLGEVIQFNCPRCGEYALSSTAIAVLEVDQRPFSDRQRAILCHAIRKRRRGEKPTIYTVDDLDAILNAAKLPAVAEQAETLVLLIGELLEGPGVLLDLYDLRHGGVIGTLNPDNFDFVLRGLEGDGLLERKGPPSRGEWTGTLTFKGWERLQELQRGRVKGLRAFMAMKFGNEELDRIYVEHFKPAASAAGFDLRKVNEEPTPGLIDNRIRVDIRESRFVVADLSDDNLGAYWEAGYAEGLGKPVIYTCERTKFESEKTTHFDTNHSLTIPWDAEDPEWAAAMLKATIRARFPQEARMRDEGAD
jgi:nucleoside 2-deoxyribosyltransferase